MKRLGITWLLIFFGLAFCFVSPVLFALEPIEKQVDQALELGNLVTATALLEEHLKSDTGNFLLWKKLSNVYEKRGNLEKAILAIRQVHFLKPDDKDASDELIRLHLLLEDARRIRKTVPSLENEAFTDVEKAHFQRVLDAKARGDLDEAFKNFIELVELNPGFLNGRDKGIVALGRDFFQKRMAGGDLDSLFYFAIYEAFSGDLQGAEENLGKFLTVQPDSPLAKKAGDYLVKIRSRPAEPSVPSSSSVFAKPASETGTVSMPILEGDSEEQKMIGWLQSGNAEAQKKALAWVVGKQRKPVTVLRGLEICLDSPDPEVVISALKLVGECGSAAVPLGNKIEMLAREEGSGTRLEAMKCLGLIKASPDHLIPWLVTFFEDADPVLANTAVQAVANYGEGAISYLQECQEKENPVLRDRASMAILLIRKNE